MLGVVKELDHAVSATRGDNRDSRTKVKSHNSLHSGGTGEQIIQTTKYDNLPTPPLLSSRCNILKLLTLMEQSAEVVAASQPKEREINKNILLQI